MSAATDKLNQPEDITDEQLEDVAGGYGQHR
jgi:hypothetical protein